LCKYAANVEIVVIELLVGEEEAEQDEEDIEIWNLPEQNEDNNTDTIADQSNKSRSNSPSKSSSPINVTVGEKNLLQIGKKTTKRKISITTSSSENSFDKTPKKTAKKTTRNKRPKNNTNTTLSSDEEKSSEKNIVEITCPQNSVMLTDEHMIAAIKMLRNQFSEIGGLVDTVRFQTDIAKSFNLNLNYKTVFIIHSNGNHWVIY